MRRLGVAALCVLLLAPGASAAAKPKLTKTQATRIFVADPKVAAWLQRAFSPDPDDRFADAAAMQAEWRTAATAVLERERRVPWWRRIFGGDESVDGWWREGDAVVE